jgi:hypothetical protein
MKNTPFKLAIMGIAAAGLFAFHGMNAGSVKGKISPADGAVRAWAESQTDTLSAPVQNGMFEIGNVKPGTYKLVIEARPPYKNSSRDGIMVVDGKSTDVGEITLNK